MNNFFLLVIMIFSTFNGFTQNDKMKDKMNIEDITEIWVYDYFNPQGYRRGECPLNFGNWKINILQKFSWIQYLLIL